MLMASHQGVVQNADGVAAGRCPVMLMASPQEVAVMLMALSQEGWP